MSTVTAVGGADDGDDFNRRVRDALLELIGGHERATEAGRIEPERVLSPEESSKFQAGLVRIGLAASQLPDSVRQDIASVTGEDESVFSDAKIEQLRALGRELLGELRQDRVNAVVRESGTASEDLDPALQRHDIANEPSQLTAEGLDRLHSFLLRLIADDDPAEESGSGERFDGSAADGHRFGDLVHQGGETGSGGGVVHSQTPCSARAVTRYVAAAFSLPLRWLQGKAGLRQAAGFGSRPSDAHSEWIADISARLKQPSSGHVDQSHESSSADGVSPFSGKAEA